MKVFSSGDLPSIEESLDIQNKVSESIHTLHTEHPLYRMAAKVAGIKQYYYENSVLFDPEDLKLINRQVFLMRKKTLLYIMGSASAGFFFQTTKFYQGNPRRNLNIGIFASLLTLIGGAAFLPMYLSRFQIKSYLMQKYLRRIEDYMQDEVPLTNKE